MEVIWSLESADGVLSVGVRMNLVKNLTGNEIG